MQRFIKGTLNLRAKLTVVHEKIHVGIFIDYKKIHLMVMVLLAVTVLLYCTFHIIHIYFTWLYISKNTPPLVLLGNMIK
jgi:hypothetical protein